MDRAFGADKNTMLAHTLAMHWQAVASHYENYVKDSKPSESQAALMLQIRETAKSLATLAESSIKGFGVVKMEYVDFKPLLEKATDFYSSLDIETDKSHWLPQAVYATEIVIMGNRKMLYNKQWWFTEN